jgi:hypothetical protein
MLKLLLEFLYQPNIAKNNAARENSNPQPREPTNSETMDCVDPPPEPMSNAADARQIIDFGESCKNLEAASNYCAGQGCMIC